MTLKLVRIVVRVEGRVQGVSYRYSTRQRALELGVVGWVRNLPNGDVEFCAEGNEASVEQLLIWSRRGPTQAQVKEVSVADRMAIAALSFTSFDIRV